MEPVLYSFRRCPYAMRARLALLSAGKRVELREVVLKNKPAQLLAASPKGTVPVLVLADGRVIDESRDIMLWALGRHDPEGWLGRQDAAAVTSRLIDENDRDFKPNLDGYKYADRHPHPADCYRAQAEVFLEALEQRLVRHEYLLGDKPTLADLAIFPFIRQFAFVDRAWFDASPYVKLRAWLNGFLASRRFARIMQKYPAWQPGDTPRYFPSPE